MVSGTHGHGFQYSSTGSINGISGYVDLDYFTDGILLSSTSSIPTSDNQDNTETAAQTTYIVQSGDTLAKIALSNNTSVEHLVALNNINNANLIYAGQKLLIHNRDDVTEDGDTNHIEYVIKKGDTLTSICEKYNVEISTVVGLNQVSNPDLIYAGYTLRVPIYIKR